MIETAKFLYDTEAFELSQFYTGAYNVDCTADREGQIGYKAHQENGKQVEGVGCYAYVCTGTKKTN